MPATRQLVLLAVATLALLAPGTARAGAPDQQQTSTAGGATLINSNVALAQTFTAGISGNLDQVDLFLSTGISQPLTVQIETVTMTGAPSGTVLASESVPAASVPDGGPGAWVSIPISPPAAVTATTQYAIVTPTVPPAELYNWWRSASDVYAGGTAFDNTLGFGWSARPFDLAFQTYVAAPSTAVTFRSLSATRSVRGVLVGWRTASELGTLGFHVFREEKAGRVRVNRSLIPAKSRGAYTFLDRRAPRGRTLRYWIQEVALDGSRRWYGPVRVRSGLGFPARRAPRLSGS